MRICPLPRSIKIRVVSSAVASSCGVSVCRTSAIGTNAVATKLTGETTLRLPSSACHCVRIDKLSLPTGIETPSAGHSAIPTARTVSYNAASSPGSPQAAIQFAESLTRLSSSGAANKLVILSAIAIRPDAAGLKIASGERSPMAIASPAKP